MTDPKFYDEISRLLEDLIQQKRDDTAAYEAFLQKAEMLVKKMGKRGEDDGLPPELQGKPEAAVLYHNLEDNVLKKTPGNVIQEAVAEYGDERLQLALKLDLAMREQAPADWRGDDAREKQILNALFPIMSRDRVATQAIFELIKNQPGY